MLRFSLPKVAYRLNFGYHIARPDTACLDTDALEAMSTVVDFDELPAVCEKLLKGQIRGRTLVKIPD